MLFPRRNHPLLTFALTALTLALIAGLGSGILRAEDPPLETLLAEHRYEEALAALLVRSEEWALEIRRNPSIQGKLDWARSLLSLGMVEDRLARYESAETHLLEAITLIENAKGPEALRGDCLDALGLTTSHRGHFEKAEQFYLAAIKVRLAAPEKSREPWLSASRDHLGLAYLEEGRYEESGILLHQSLEATAPDRRALLAQRHGYLARYYHTLHNFARARDLLEEAIPHAETAWGRDHPNTLTLLGQLGLTSLRLGDPARARALLEEVTTLSRLTTTDTTSALRLAGFLNNLGSLNLIEGDPESARALFEESLQVLEQTLGPDHLALAPLRNNLACTLQELGDHASAARYLLQARDAYLRSMGPNHQRSVEALSNLALNTLLQVGPTAARTQIAEASTAAGLVLNRLLLFGTERQRLNYLQNVDLLSLACSAGEDPELIANTLLASKGRLLEVLLEERSRPPRPALRKLHQTQEKLDRLLLAATSPDSSEVTKLRQDLHLLERELAKESTHPPPTHPPSWQELQAALPAHSAFIDFVQFTDYAGESDWESRYGAILILPDGPPRWIPLASESILQTWLDVLSRRLAYRAACLSGKDLPAPILKLQPCLRQLHQEFWASIETLLPADTNSLCLCPDASLNFLSFSVLLDEDNRFLASRYPLCTYVASGRDLLLEAHEADLQSAPWHIFAVDTFAPAPTTPGAGTPVQAQLAQTIANLAPLAGARREAKELKPFLAPDSIIHFGSSSNEETLRSLPSSPAVLHLITHGFFLGEQGRGPNPHRLQDFDDDPRPLYRSGLVLHGAKRALASSPPPASSRDDILFASDVAALPLQGTELVTLSSCQSALGEALAGEGVLGLRRGFATAGARHLLLTLWPVSDATTPDFMRRFYELATETKHLSQAAWQTQREGLANIDPNNPEALEQAVFTMGPFLLCQRQGLLPARPFSPPHNRTPVQPLWIALCIGGALIAILFLATTRKSARR